MALPIQFDRCVVTALKNHVNLGVMLMVVLAGIAMNLRQVNGSGKLGPLSECSSGDTTGAIDGWQRVQIDDDGFSWHAIEISGWVDFVG